MLTCRGCGSLLVAVDGQWVCPRRLELGTHDTRIDMRQATIKRCGEQGQFSSVPSQPFNIGGHKRRNKDVRHKGTWRTCASCNPESYAYWRRQEARAKGRKR